MKVSTCSHRSILVPSGLNSFDFQVDPYVGCEHYCCYCYVLKNAETDWTREICIHRDIAGQLDEELEKITPQKIYMGYFTDPYQPSEAGCGQTRKVLALLLKRGFSAGILTKSDLVVRDVDLLKEMDGASVSVSVAFNDNHSRQFFEARTIDTEDRIDALRRLKAAGIDTSALICPVIPHITDVMPLIDSLAPLTSAIWIYGLGFEKPSDHGWVNVKSILAAHFPQHLSDIEKAVFSKDHPYWLQLREKLNAIKKHRGLDLRIHL